MGSLLAARVPRVLSIAGTDPTGGAGTAADLKSITAAGGYGMAVVTAVLAQNTHGVRAVHTVPSDLLRQQLLAVSDDVHLDAVKTGMLADATTIDVVASWLDEHPASVLVIDPVMVATSGDSLLKPEAEQAMLEFCRRATVITPNVGELARLVGKAPAADAETLVAQARSWAAEHGTAVVVKTGHLAGPSAENIWVSPDGTAHAAAAARIETTSTHGTGCSLASALATRLGAGHDPEAALGWTTGWLHEAIQHGAALEVGSGHGPVDHSHRARRLAAAADTTPWIAPGQVPQRLASPDETPRADAAHAAHVGHDGATGAALDAAVAPVGPWTTALWDAGRETARMIAGSDFVRALVDGTLPQEQFSFYLAQDALYLARYSRALATLSARADTAEGQVFWASSAQLCITTEGELHRDWLSTRTTVPARPELSPVTSAYTDFLLASTAQEEHAVGCAAVLPCYWLYAQTGAALPEVPDEHPYAAWLETYRDPAFVEGVQQALARVEAAMEQASPIARARALRAYLLACRHELEFFEQALRLSAS